MYKCGSFAVLSVALSLSSSMLFSDVGKAQSAFDDHVVVEEKLSFTTCGVYHSWTADEIRTLVMAYIYRYGEVYGTWHEYSDEFNLISTSIENNEKNFYLRQDHSTAAIYLNVFNDDSRWFMQSWNSGTRSYFRGENVEFTYRMNINLNNQFFANRICDAQDFEVNDFDSLMQALENGRVYTSNGEEVLDFIVTFGGDQVDRINIDSSSNTMNLKGYNDTPRILAFSGNLTLPPGYEGPEIPNAIPSPTDQEEIRPNFSYTVSDKDISAIPQEIPSKLPTEDDDFQLEWFLQSCESHDPVTWSCENGEIVDRQALGKAEAFNYKVDDYGWYKLSVNFWVEKCHRYDSWPATPDYCYSFVPESTSEYKYVQTVIFLNVNGDSISGSTLDDDCTLGYCKPVSEFKECEWDGILKIGEYIGCQIHNFFIHFKNFLSLIFVPKWSDIRPHFDRFTETAGNQLGFLYDSFAMLGSAFNLIVATGNPNVGYTCDIPLTFFGRTGNVQLCAWRYQNPDMWALMQRSIQAGISLTLVYVFWRKFNKMTGRDVEDGTEIEATGSAHPAQHLDWVDERTGERGKIK